MFSRRTPTHKEMELFGELIREARKGWKLTQEDLAELMGCSLRWISRIERGKSSPNWRDTICLMEILGLSLEEVVKKVELNVPVLTRRE